MRILFYISTIRGGGAARVMTNLANQFSEEGNEVYLLTNFISDSEYNLHDSVKRLTIEQEESRANIVAKNFHRIRTLRNTIKIFSPELVVSFMHENDIRAYLATRFLNVKLVLSVRNDPKTLYRNKIKGRLARYVYARADGVVFQTKEAAEWFGSALRNSKIIYNQITENFFLEDYRNDGKNIVTTGKFLQQKNHRLLFEAYKKIVDKIEDNLIIYGDGKLRSNYVDWIKTNGLEERVSLPGNTKEVAARLAESKLFVMSSDYEGMPNSLMEAMAVGVPSISTDCPCGGPRELAKGGGVILVPLNDADSLAEAMLTILNDNKMRQVLSVNAKKTAATFAPKRVYHEWESYFKTICVK